MIVLQTICTYASLFTSQIIAKTIYFTISATLMMLSILNLASVAMCGVCMRSAFNLN